MAFIFRTLRLVPTAIRVSVAGGVTYGTVKAGAWSDSSESREKLANIQETLQSVREIEYPPVEHTNIPSKLAANEAEVGALRSSFTQSWNNAVKRTCEAVIAEGDGGQSFISGGLKSLTDKFSQWTK